jgi:hypothetical protein
MKYVSTRTLNGRSTASMVIRSVNASVDADFQVAERTRRRR